ncbi:MAG: hypothetical protein ACOCXH_00195 [Cyclobacteriaceae bacterium]
MYTVLLIDDNEANQLIVEKNINTISGDVKIVTQSTYQSAIKWIEDNDLPDAIIANCHIWSSSNNIFTFIDKLRKIGNNTCLPVFASAISITKKQQIQLLNYSNLVCLLEMPITLVDAAIVVNQLHKKNFIDTMLFAS